MREEWRDIPGFEGRYQVSDCGRVRSLLYGRTLVMRQYTHYKGHLFVCLYAEKGKPDRKYFMHRLVAMAFLPAFDDKEIVNHIDGDKKHNAADNLEWTSSGDNTRHYRKGVQTVEERNQAF